MQIFGFLDYHTLTCLRSQIILRLRHSMQRNGITAVKGMWKYVLESEIEIFGIYNFALIAHETCNI